MNKRKTLEQLRHSQYDYLASEYLVRSNSQMVELALQANNLYNRALYDMRQAFIKYRQILSYTDLYHLFKSRLTVRECMLYQKLGYAQTAQQTLREVNGNFSTWLKALKDYKANPHKYTGRPRMPKYLQKKSHHLYFFVQNAVKVSNGYLHIRPINLHLKLRNNEYQIKRVAIKPSFPKYKVILQYKLNRKIIYKEDNQNIIGIDPGVDNAFACVNSQAKQPLIINGKNVKSINQFYNKKMAQLKHLQVQYHQLESQIITKQGLKPVYRQTKSMRQITNWRNQKIKEFTHKASKRIVDYALNCGTTTIIIGRNKFWKQNSNLNAKNNQNFVGISHARMINSIQYKANLQGITLIRTNESYTSQTSFLDHEKPCWNNGNKSRKKQSLSPISRRIKRGLFKSNQDKLINADINGALQIIKKVFPKASFANGIEDVVLHPAKITIDV